MTFDELLIIEAMISSFLDKYSLLYFLSCHMNHLKIFHIERLYWNSCVCLSILKSKSVCIDANWADKAIL